MTTIHEGGCLCRAVRYKVMGEPVATPVCHCRFCQIRTGSAFAPVGYFREGDVKVIGKLANYEHRSDESNRWVRIEFCPICGTPVTHTAEVFPGSRGISVGTFDQPGWFRQARHVWTRSKMAWVSVPPDAEVFTKSSFSTPIEPS